MNILLLIPSLNMGGAERQAINFACWLREHGDYVEIIGFGKPGPVENICQKEKIKCYLSFDGVISKREPLTEEFLDKL
mgnify:CR=1 FL=1